MRSNPSAARARAPAARRGARAAASPRSASRQPAAWPLAATRTRRTKRADRGARFEGCDSEVPTALPSPRRRAATRRPRRRHSKLRRCTRRAAPPSWGRYAPLFRFRLARCRLAASPAPRNTREQLRHARKAAARRVCAAQRAHARDVTRAALRPASDTVLSEHHVETLSATAPPARRAHPGAGDTAVPGAQRRRDTTRWVSATRRRHSSERGCI
jgi:hypothetical protein